MKSIVIKGNKWKIKRVENLVDDSNEPVLGLCDPHARTISIDKKLEGDEFNDTLVHEINHAIVFELHVELPREIEEIIAEGFAQVYKKISKKLFPVTVTRPRAHLQRNVGTPSGTHGHDL